MNRITATTHHHPIQLPLSLSDTEACEGLDCATRDNKTARDWFGDVELVAEIDDVDRDQFGDLTGA